MKEWIQAVTEWSETVKHTVNLHTIAIIILFAWNLALSACIIFDKKK